MSLKKFRVIQARYIFVMECGGCDVLRMVVSNDCSDVGRMHAYFTASRTKHLLTKQLFFPEKCDCPQDLLQVW